MLYKEYLILMYSRINKYKKIYDRFLFSNQNKFLELCRKIQFIYISVAGHSINLDGDMSSGSFDSTASFSGEYPN